MSQISQIKKIYHAAIYVRLSKEDGAVASHEKTESNSIANQKSLIRDFLENKNDIEVVQEYVDDGFSGSNFERPAFQMMLEDIKKGKIDCVVTKDLSRFGREYIDSGMYIERLFPAMGVRFIAINDGIDSGEAKSQSDEIIIPFKNLINDAYCRDISIKIRSHLEIKRKQGDVITAFVPYGYKKNDKDKHKLEIDVYAANVVKDIFRMKLHGKSQDAIACELNSSGILPPAEYKASTGSLTGIILSQEGDCPNNMVLQTSCRCLRQVVKGKVETALIYLNEKNAEKLDKQLQQQHHISIQEIQTVDNEKKIIKRYNRMDRLKLPNVDFYQMKVQYDTLVTEKSKPSEGISNAISNAHNVIGIIRTTDFTMKDGIRSVDDKERGTQVANFNIWINNISKGGFGYPSVDDLFKFSDGLQSIFQKITYEKNGISFFSSKYDTEMIEAAIRKAFHDKRTFKTSEELIPEEASLLNIENFHEEIRTDKVKDYYPDYIVVEKIIDEDNGKLKPDKKTQQLIELARETNNTQILTALLQQFVSHNNKDRSFHYLPYRTDSKFEQVFLKEVLSLDVLEELGLEIYYNGDSSLTEFKIKCYEKTNKNWRYVGIYTPDFLIIQRKKDKISKVIIVETKGQIYANDPTFKQKKNFMQEYFISLNNKQFGYEKFDYLYLEDTLSDNDRILKTHRNKFYTDYQR